MAEKSRILIVGATGYLGKFMLEASVKAGHPTFALVRESTIADPAKGKVVEDWKSLGVTILPGDLHDHAALVKAIKHVDVVISTLGGMLLADQVKLVAAIKEAGCVKFGNDVDHTNALQPARSIFDIKVNLRRHIESEGIPYTYVVAHFFAGYFLPSLCQAGATSPPRDKVVILGDGNQKAIFNKEEDIATYTIRAVGDPRTLNKVLYIKPAANIHSFNDLVTLWEKKIGKKVNRIYVPEEQVIKNIQEAPMPVNITLSISHCVFVKGDHTNFEIDLSVGVEASTLYPDVKYTTVDEYLSKVQNVITEKKRVQNDAWSTRMREKYGLDTSEFTYNPSESVSGQPAEERSRGCRGCTIL